MEKDNISFSTEHANISTTFQVTTEINDFNNTTNCSDATSVVSATVLIQKYFTPCVYVTGIPGNVLSFLVWIRPRMQNSSGVYLATLALVDLLFLIFHIIYALETFWEIRLIRFPVICECFPIIFVSLQYFDPLLVLAYTVERYISICHPFKREQYCTKTRARLVTLSLGAFSLGLGVMQGYFWSYGDEMCRIREEVLIGGVRSIWQVWALTTESVTFLFVPLCVLALNVLVLREIRRKRFSDFDASQVNQRKEKSSASTTVLLYASFYFILSTLPVSAVYLAQFYFKLEKECEDPAFQLSSSVVQALGYTHFAVNFYIYITTGEVFRKETIHMLRIKREDALYIHH